MSKQGRTRALAALAAITAGLVFAGAAAAQTPGSLDTGFGSRGVQVGAVGSWTAGVASAVQPDGDIVSVGAATIGGENEVAATRLLPSGAFDRTFGVNGWAVVPIGKSAGANAVAIQPNGDIVIAGTGRNQLSGTLALAAVRLLPTGLLDSSFGAGGIVTVPIGSESIANAVAIQTDGRILVGGTALTDTNHFVAVRLTSSGALDQSFGNQGVELLAPNAAGWGMSLEADGTIVLGGVEVYGGTNAYMAARLLPNGSPDPSFGAGGIVTVPIGTSATGLAVTTQPDGDVVLTGNAIIGSQVAATVRLLPSGALDQSFGTGGVNTVPGGGVNAIALDANGKIVLAGPGPSAVRINPNGSLDTTFGKGGLAIVSLGVKASANGVVVQPADGKLVLTAAAAISGRITLLDVRLFG